MSRALLLEHADEMRRRNSYRIQRRRLRDELNPLELSETDFIAHFRLNKVGYLQVVEELRCYLPAVRRKTGISNEIRILAALHFFATGSYQRPIGSSIFNCISQPTFSRCLHEVVDALNIETILKKFIKFPTSQIQRESIMEGFMEKFGFPGIIGCIDGTHVAIFRPKEHEETFLNRKNYHSLNVMIICDINLNILHVDASFGGASHDSYVWNQSEVKNLLENLPGRDRCWLLGDSGYAQRPWMMTPILGTASGSPEEYYTQLHCCIRCTVERCIGVLKARWRCLLAHRVLHYDPITAGRIVNACVCLHNIANRHGITVPDVISDVDDQQQENLVEVVPYDSTRTWLVRRLWNSRP